MWKENNTHKKNYHKYLDLLTNTILRPMLIKSLIFELKLVKRNFIAFSKYGETESKLSLAKLLKLEKNIFGVIIMEEACKESALLHTSWHVSTKIREVVAAQAY